VLSFLFCLHSALIPEFTENKTPVSPPVALGVHLVFWICFVTTGLLALDAIYTLDCQPTSANEALDLPDHCRSRAGSWLYNHPTNDDLWGYRPVNKHDKNCWRDREVVVAVMMWLAMFFHFLLFLFGCVQTHRRRRGREQAQRQKSYPDAATDTSSTVPMGEA
jgi:hypothetical protein